MSTIATLTDLYGVMPASQMGSVTTLQRQARLDAAEDEALSYLNARYSLDTPPRGPFPPRLVEAICELAAWAIVQLRGYKPSQGDKNFKERAEGTPGVMYSGARGWLDGVARQRFHPAIVETAASPVNMAPMVISSAPQGWNDCATVTTPLGRRSGV